MGLFLVETMMSALSSRDQPKILGLGVLWWVLMEMSCERLITGL